MKIYIPILQLSICCIILMTSLTSSSPISATDEISNTISESDIISYLNSDAAAVYDTEGYAGQSNARLERIQKFESEVVDDRPRRTFPEVDSRGFDEDVFDEGFGEWYPMKRF